MRFSAFLFAVVFFTGFSAAVLFSDTVLTDPLIPDGEKISYSVTIENRTFTRMQTILQKTENGKELYEVTSDSQSEDQRLKIDRRKMEVVYSWTKVKAKYFTVEKEITTHKNVIPTNKNEIAIIEYNGMTHLFRGFPFPATRSIRVRTSEGGDILILATFTKETDVATKLGTVRCFELEVGLDGLLGIFFPKTYVWYTKEAPHYMVKYEGISGGPGSPVMKMEITGYEVK
ncbi:MAG: hypothetical protein JW904_09555 [Spirochaetales bacterium]|nr:hypothetical protein [Spirochaetales bacterium]